MRNYRTQLRRFQRELERRRAAERTPVQVVDELRGEKVQPGAKVIAVVNVDMDRL